MARTISRTPDLRTRSQATRGRQHASHSREAGSPVCRAGSGWPRPDLESGHLAELAFTPRSDLVRLDLLARHGGVWGDATCYCAVPLDSWLPAATSSGFFAFRCGPRGDRHIASWFLAASPSNAIILSMYEMMLPYWRDHVFHNETHPYLFKMLNGKARAPKAMDTHLVLSTGSRWTGSLAVLRNSLRISRSSAN